MGPDFVLQIREIVTALENDDQVKVVVFESAVDGVFLNHSDFLANFDDLTGHPARSDRPRGMARRSGAPDACPVRFDRADPGASHRKRK